MTTAVLNLASGTKVTIEGTSEEVAALLALLDRGEQRQEAQEQARSRRPALGAKATPTSLIQELVAEGFFREPRSLSAVNDVLRTRGHFYPPTTLSPTLLRLVRSKRLRRLRDGKTWTYVN